MVLPVLGTYRQSSEKMSKTLKQSIIEASHRLRAVQKDFADEDEQQQKEYLCEELAKLLEEIPYGQRKAFLQGLLERFPIWQLQTAADAGTVCPPAETPPTVPAEPMLLIEALTNKLPSLPTEEKEAILDRLREVIPPLPQAADASAQSATGIGATLQMPADTINQERFGELANLLAEFVFKVEQLTVAVWSKISGRSTLRPPKQIKKTAGRFLGKDGGDTEELVKELRLLLQFATAIMTAASRAGDEVARRYSRKVSPDAINSLVEMEQSRLRDTLLSKEVRCWRKYCELAGELGAEYVEKEIESAMADYAEAFVRGLERLG